MSFRTWCGRLPRCGKPTSCGDSVPHLWMVRAACSASRHIQCQQAVAIPCRRTAPRRLPPQHTAHLLPPLPTRSLLPMAHVHMHMHIHIHTSLSHHCPSFFLNILACLDPPSRCVTPSARWLLAHRTLAPHLSCPAYPPLPSPPPPQRPGVDCMSWSSHCGRLCHPSCDACQPRSRSTPAASCR